MERSGTPVHPISVLYSKALGSPGRPEAPDSLSHPALLSLIELHVSIGEVMAEVMLEPAKGSSDARMDIKMFRVSHSTFVSEWGFRRSPPCSVLSFPEL